MSGSTLGDWGGTQMFCPTQAILSVVKPPGSREGHTSQKDCGPYWLLVLPDINDN